MYSFDLSHGTLVSGDEPAKRLEANGQRFNNPVVCWKQEKVGGMPNQADSWTVSVVAGKHHLPATPVVAPVPAAVADADLGYLSLHRVGRDRPLPAQMMVDDGRLCLAFVADPLHPGQEVVHRLTAEGRQRRARTSVTIGPDADGLGSVWQVAIDGRSRARLFFPSEGAVRWQFDDAGVALTFRVDLLGFPHLFGGPRRTRCEPPGIAEGPVLAQATAAYNVGDGSAWWRERYRVRAWKLPDDITVMDLNISWIAAAGPLPFATNQQNLQANRRSFAWLPLMRIEKAPHIGEDVEWSDDSGLLADELRGRRVRAVRWRLSGRRGVLYFAPLPDGELSRVTWTEPEAVEISPISNASPEMLATGHHWNWSARLMTFPGASSGLTDQAAALGFERPPFTRWHHGGAADPPTERLSPAFRIPKDAGPGHPIDREHEAGLR